MEHLPKERQKKQQPEQQTEICGACLRCQTLRFNLICPCVLGCWVYIGPWCLFYWVSSLGTVLGRDRWRGLLLILKGRGAGDRVHRLNLPLPPFGFHYGFLCRVDRLIALFDFNFSLFLCSGRLVALWPYPLAHARHCLHQSRREVFFYVFFLWATANK